MRSASWSLAGPDSAGQARFETATAAAFREPGVTTVPVRSRRRDTKSSEILPPESRREAMRRFATETRSAFVPESSAAASAYRRVVPGDGFDRMTANRTNYVVSLPDTAPASDRWQSCAHDTMRSGRAACARSQGPTLPRSDEPQAFDLVTGLPANPSMTYRPAGPRRSGDVAIVTQTVGSTTDPSRGVSVAIPARAPSSRVEDRRLARGALGTLPALRPLTPSGRDFYETFRR
ncbi:hypothetical protein FNF31_02813 [Cafeteria roenbergensis]|nr:hypothetical protein FNF31_02813 [Cafeteria roenbergensis]